MKNLLVKHRSFSALPKYFIYAVIWLLLLPSATVAQNDSAAKSTAPEAIEISPGIQFTCVQKGDNTIDLRAAVGAKYEGSFYKLSQLKIVFSLVHEGEDIVLGQALTNVQGKAVINVKADSLPVDKDGKLNFKASFAGIKNAEAAEEELSVKRARIEMTSVKEDSLLKVQVKLIDLSTGKPVPEIAIGIFVKRLYKPLKVGEGTTDENGEATVEVPNQLPGDAKGDLTLLAKLDENETYGNLESAVQEKWGVPVSDKIEIQQRSLFSSNPPVWMLVTFIILMTVVWGHYIVIVFEMIRLRKEEPNNDTVLTDA